MKLEVEATADQADGDPYSSALTNTALAVSGAIAFGAGINQFMGAEKAVQFFAGYVVELSLSVDNLFVFLLLFDFFKVGTARVKTVARVVGVGLHFDIYRSNHERRNMNKSYFTRFLNFRSNHPVSMYWTLDILHCHQS